MNSLNKNNLSNFDKKHLIGIIITQSRMIEQLRDKVKKLESYKGKFYRFFDLQKKEIFDDNKVCIGQIIDIVIHKDMHISFIVGGKGFKAFLKRIGSSSNAYMVVPHRFIKNISDYNIEIHKSKEDLEKLFMGKPINPKSYREFNAQKQSSSEMKIQLQKDSYIQITQQK